MADETTQKPPELTIAAFIASYTALVKLSAGGDLMLRHNGDSAVLQLPAGVSEATFKWIITESQTDEDNKQLVKTVKHEPKTIVLTKGVVSQVITLTGEGQINADAFGIKKYFVNIDYHISLISYTNDDGTNHVNTNPPPDPPSTPPDEQPFPWWIVGAAALAAVAIVIVWYFYRRRASIPGPAAPATPAAAPSSVVVVK